MTTFIFRADASVNTGGGHVLRSLVLAKSLVARGHKCCFVSVEGSFAFVPLTTEGVEILEIKKSDSGNFDFLNAISKQHSLDAIVIDSYELGIDYEFELSKRFSKVIVFDDKPSRKHNSNLLIDPTLGRVELEYKPLVNSDCQFLLGPNFAPLRMEFNALRDQSIELRLTKEPRNLLISYGLTDPQNLTFKTISALRAAIIDNNLTADVVIGKNTLAHFEIEKLVKSMNENLRLHVNVSAMARLMLDSDIILGSPGSSSWERCCMGIPSVLTSVADNQIQIGENLHKSGCALYLGLFQNDFSKGIQDALEQLLRNNKIRTKMVQAAAEVCTGLGSQLVSEQLEKLTNQK